MQKPRVVLHCGIYKTGSSAIQNWAWRNRDWLATRGWLYPKSGLDSRKPSIGCRHWLLAAWHKSKRGAWQGLIDALIEEIDAAGVPNVLLSAEAWSNPANRTGLAGTVWALRGAGFEVSAVAFLRARGDYARSVYREWCRRRGNRLPFAAFLNEMRTLVDPVSRAAALRDMFGDAVSFLLFDQEQDPVETLAGFLGLGCDRAMASQRTNEGLDAVGAELCRLLNLDKADATTRRRVLAAKTFALPCPRAAYGERFPADFQETAASFAVVRGLTGWPDDRAVRLLAEPTVYAEDVAAVSDLIRQTVYDCSRIDRRPVVAG